MRSISEFLPDVQIAASGVPSFVALHYLARATSDFVRRSEVWKEWSYDTDPADIGDDGVFEWDNNIDPEAVDAEDYLWLTVKRVEMIQWGNDSCTIHPKTARQAAQFDREWRSRTGTPAYFVQEGNGGGSVRFVPIPETFDADLVVNARLVMNVEVTNGLPTSDLNAQVPELPDGLFHDWRETIVAGALALLYAIPGKDWSQPSQIEYQKVMFEQGVIRASANSARDNSNTGLTVAYNDYC